jgi:proteic killer suppression protein
MMISLLTIDVIIVIRYCFGMIKSFKCTDTQSLHEGRRVARFVNIERVALRKLRQLDIAERLGDLRIPPQNRLEALKGNRKSQHSIRINDQWRVCFVWRNGNAYDVESVDNQ